MSQQALRYTSCTFSPTYKRPWVLAFLMAVSFIFCYAGVITALARQWLYVDIYSHGFLIPFVSGYLAWIRRDQLGQLIPSPNVFGSPVFMIGLFFLLAGDAGAVLLFQELSLIICLIGIVLLLLGSHFLKLLWFPIAYLLFMIPIWGILTGPLHIFFQQLSTALGSALLKLINIPVYRDGIYIELPNITLQVAQACSGLNYLIAVIAIAIPTAYLFLEGRLRRLALICFATFIGIVANGVRVALVGFICNHGLSVNTHGPFHVLQGLFVSFVGFAALFVGLATLRRMKPAAPKRRSHRGNTTQPVIANRKKNYQLGILIVILLLLAGNFLYFYRPNPITLKKDFAHFPLEVGEWRGQDTEPLYTAFRSLGVDHELSRIYETPKNHKIHLYIGYYESQKQEKELINYMTEGLHLNSSAIESNVDSHNLITTKNLFIPRNTERGSSELPSFFSSLVEEKTSIFNSRLIVPRKAAGWLIFFWYDLNGRITTNPYLAKLYAAWDGLLHRRNNGAIVIVTTELDRMEALSHTLLKTKQFIRKMHPLLGNYLPRS